ncbi:MAG: hypothetical protein ACYDHN_07460 [Solirubrobacteraceae bacterium]
MGAAAAVLGALIWPLLFTYSGFAGDWEHDLWLVWHQSTSIKSNGLPSFFLNSSYSLLNPIFAFYAGTLYSIAGALALLVGPVQAYILIYLLDFAAVLGGWYWLGRMAGLGRWVALVPGVIFITSTYFIAIVYVQGDWPEFTGISMIPLMVASGLSVLRADRLRYPPMLALAVSSLLFFGSHNLTILLALTTLGLTGLAVVVLVPAARACLSRRALARVCAIVVPAALVSAWYLLPAVVYSSRTRVGGEYHNAQITIRTTAWLVSSRHLLTLSRTSGIGLPAPYYLAMALPVLAIVWVLVAVVILPRGSWGKTWTRILLICCGVAVLVTAVMTHVGLLLALPRPYTMMQFSYRLDVYVVLMLCAAVLAALVLLGRSPARRALVWRWFAIPVCAVSLIGAVQQIGGYPDPGQDRYTALETFGEVETGNNRDYQDGSARQIAGRTLPKLYFPLEALQGDSVSGSTTLPAGTLVSTNIAAGSYLLHVSGARPVGVDSESADMVLAIGSAEAQASTAASSPPRTITVSSGSGAAIVIGRVLTLCGLAALIAQLLLRPAYRLLARRHVGAGAS